MLTKSSSHGPGGIRSLAQAMIAVLLFCSVSHAQTVTVLPNQIPNGITSPSQFRQRIDIVLNGPDVGLTTSFTITMPPEVTLVANSATVTSDNPALVPFLKGFPSGSQLAFGLTGTANGDEVSVQFDVRTPVSFTGISSGAALDTAYVVDFADDLECNADRRPLTSLHQNRQIQFVKFTAPDSTIGDTTTLGGRLYHMEFKPQFGAQGLPDLSHTGLTTASQGFADNTTDVTYTFYVSTDSTLIRSSSQTAAALFTIGADDQPLTGQRQNPRLIPGTFIREDFTTVFADSTEAMIALANAPHNDNVFIYMTSDVTGDWFLGRSGPLLVLHPPEFVIAGWDYDDDGGDDFNTTGIVQVPSELIGGGGQKDNNDITVDSGLFLARGSAIPQTGFSPSSLSSVELLFKVEDSDNAGTVEVGIFLLSTAFPSATLADLDPLRGGSPDKLSNAILVTPTLLTAADRVFDFEPLTRHAVADTITDFIDPGDYHVYFGAMDADGNKALHQVRRDPFDSPARDAVLTVGHSPTLTIDLAQFNDFDGDGDLDVETGIGLSQMINSTNGLELSTSPSRQIVPISWGRAGIEGDLDVDDSATLGLYFSTRSNFREAGASAAYTSGNSDGTDLLNTIARGGTDTHEIQANIDLSSDDQLDNLFEWDLWSYVSPEGTVPATDTRYFIYGILKGGGSQRLVSFTGSGALNFQHPPYVMAKEPRGGTVTASTNHPVTISWSAVDVDNGGTPLSGVPSNGLSAPNSRNNAPNIRILLSSVNLSGSDVTTWATITALSTNQKRPIWIANSTDGSLAGEIELNEGVDSTFVIRGEFLHENLGGRATQGVKINTDLDVYIAIDGKGDGSQPTHFAPFSPVVRAPSAVRFTGTEPTGKPAADDEWVVSNGMKVAVGEMIQWSISPNVNPYGTKVEVVNIYVTVDSSHFSPVDQDPVAAGIQPFSVGSKTMLDTRLVTQGAYLDPTAASTWRLDFRYDDNGGSGITFFDGAHPLAILNLQAIRVTGASSITIDDSGSRTSNMLDHTLTDLNPATASTSVTISSRTTVAGTVPLQNRRTTAHPSADVVTFSLRKVGSFVTFADSLFELQDIDSNKDGVQVRSNGSSGTYTLTQVPPGRWILSAAVDRYLTGHDTLDVTPGTPSIAGFNPVKLGDGSGSELMGGDAAGYNDKTGASLPDNFIDGSDISAINASLFKLLGDSDYNTFADINQDSVVNGTDKDMATANQTSNIGEVGKKVPVFPTFKQALMSGDNTEALISLAGVPTEEIKPGDTFDVKVMVDGANLVRTYEFHVSYDPEKLAVVDLVSTGSLFTNYLFDVGGKIREGDFGIVNSILGPTPVGGSGAAELGTVRFRAISRASETHLCVSDALLINVEHNAVTPRLGEGFTVGLSRDPIRFHDEDGEVIYGLIHSDVDDTIDFNDFITLAASFRKPVDHPDYDLRADLTGDDTVDFSDFLIFSRNFGKTAVDVPPSTKRMRQLTKPLQPRNLGTIATLTESRPARAGQPIKVRLGIEDAEEVTAWCANVSFDPSVLAFKEVKQSDGSLLTLKGDAPLLLVHSEGPGSLTVGNALSSGVAAEGSVGLVELVFEPLTDDLEHQVDLVKALVYDDLGRSTVIVGDGPLVIQPLPADFALHQNFPNPFNPETQISYDLAEEGPVWLEIYSITGQVVRTLVREPQPAGRYRVVWQGDDASGRRVASGIYFSRMVARDFHAVRKLMLLK